MISLNLRYKEEGTFICLLQASFDYIANLTQVHFIVCPVKTVTACREGQKFSVGNICLQ